MKKTNQVKLLQLIYSAISNFQMVNLHKILNKYPYA